MCSRQQIKIYRWRDEDSLHGNFGDELTALVLQRLFNLEAVPVAMHKAELLGSGSILDHFWIEQGWKCRQNKPRKLIPAKDLHVWGSGFILDDSEMEWPQCIHLHAVRGDLTRQRIGAPEIVMGDPGILASALVERRPAPAASVTIVPHYDDYPWACSHLPEPARHWQIVNPEQPVEQVLTQIASSELVLSSSLHGLIAADSFGIPAVWLRTNDELYGNTLFKFHDYATSRGCPLNQPLGYMEAARLTPDELHSISTMPTRCISDWQEALIKAFPF